MISHHFISQKNGINKQIFIEWSGVQNIGSHSHNRCIHIVSGCTDSNKYWCTNSWCIAWSL